MIVSLMDAKGPRHFHRVLAEHLDRWVAKGWSVVYEDHDSHSLKAQGQHAYLIEWVGQGEPVAPRND